MSRRFLEQAAYGEAPASYELLPFRFLALDAGREVLVNEVGEFLVAPSGTARDVVRRRIDTRSDLYRTLKAKQFVFDAETAPLVDILATKYRTRKSFLDGFTALHIFVVTLRCEHSCHYCQVSRQSADRTRFDMSFETACRSVDLMMASPSKRLTMEFQGGEPLLAIDLIRQVVPYAKERAAAAGRSLEIVVATNLAPATDEILRYLRDEGIKVSTSLDGPAFIHNANRPRPGNNSHELALDGIRRARETLGIEQVSALMTTTKLSLDHPIEIVDEYVKHDFRSISLRSISPYGFALKTRRRTGYETERFLLFYKTALAYILDLNRKGVPLLEGYAKVQLTKILTPFPTGYVDLQSPAGAGLSVLVYNYDGDVYATDESRMLAETGDTSFRLGNVHRDGHHALFTSPAFRLLSAAACNESLPGCADCAFQPYCGADPVFHHATQGDLFGHRPTSGFCQQNMGLLRHLFGLIAEGDKETMRIFFAWIRDLSLDDIRMGAPG